MSKYNLIWEASDVLLLEALLLATGGEGGAPLQEVLLMTDALEGTVLTLQEVEEGLQKLLSSGCINIQKNKLYLNNTFLEEYEQVTLTEGITEETKPLEKLLEQKKLTEESIEAVRQTVMKKYKLKNHYQQYLEQYG